MILILVYSFKGDSSNYQTFQASVNIQYKCKECKVAHAGGIEMNENLRFIERK